jgi:serine/threonine protein kinase
MDFCECTLQEQLEQGLSLSEQEVREAVLQIGRGLEYLHSKGFIVRLLTPRCVFVRKHAAGTSYLLGLLPHLHDARA